MPIPKPKSSGTMPTQMRLDATTKAEIEALRAHFGLSSLAETVRFATHKLYQEITKGKGKT